MKKAFGTIALLFVCLPIFAQEDDFDKFMQEEMASFDSFMSEAEKAFVDFMRNPWVKEDAKKPVEKIEKPKPTEPVVFDAKKTPPPTKPTQLNIEDIMKVSTAEGGLKGKTRVIDIEDIISAAPKKPAAKRPTVIVVKEESKAQTPEQPTVKPESKPETRPDSKPSVKPEEKPESKPLEKAEPKPEAKPEDKPAVKPETKPETTPAPQPSVVKPEPKPAPTPKPTTKPAAKAEPKSAPLYTGDNSRTKLVYGGNTYYLSNSLKGKCKLNNLKENAVADAFEAMYKVDNKALLTDLKQIKKDLSLNDWGDFTLVRTVADAFCSSEAESVVMQQFLLNAMGYKAKMARKASGDKMLLFVATNCQIYGHPYIEQDGLTYYNINGKEACPFYICKKDAPSAAAPFNMSLKSAPAFSGEMKTSTHTSKNNVTSVSVSVPKSLIDFYASYPQVDYAVYASASVSPDVESQLLSSLIPLMQGKTKPEAANLLINFVQTGFEYATDQQQFNYEKPFFVEELFYYPYCDCEDRSVLFAYLVEKLLGLDVVLLNYPNHIATAVCFEETVNGDYVMVNGKRYTVCDPTYIGASIGMTMTQFKQVAPKVVQF